ncbi:MAG: hypothetical protein WH035_04655 [Spirochaetota bacterium]
MKKIILLDKKKIIFIISLAFIIFLIIILISFPFKEKVSKEKVIKLMEELNKQKSLEEKILLLQKQIKKIYNKDIIMTLSSLYVEKQDYDNARNLLYRYMKKANIDVLERYEFASYYLGITLDYILSIGKKEIKTIEKIDQKFKNSVNKRLIYLEKKLKKANNIEKLKIEYDKLLKYKTDPYQLERMMGDYFFRNNQQDEAYKWYFAFYSDLNKPISYFTTQPLRNYIQILINRNEYKEAIIYQGYLCNLFPYMFDDLMALSELFDKIQQPLSSLFISMFMNTLAQNYDEIEYRKSIALILSYLEKLKGTEYYKLAYNLVNSFLIGKEPENVEDIINKFIANGINNFFFEYLLGVCSSIKKDYLSAKDHFEKFNKLYPYCAESYFLLLDSILNIEGKEGKDIKTIVFLAEKVIELKPSSQMAIYCKKYIGKSIGLNEKQSLKLITTPELIRMVDGFTKNGESASIFTSLLDSFDNPDNVYLTAAIQILSEIKERKNELITFLKMYYLKANKEQKRNIDIILSNLEKGE